MKTQRRNVSNDRLTITRRNKRSKKTDGTTKTSKEPIPIDLIIEIFSRLQAKPVARFRFVSKLWSSVLIRPYFTELFLTRSRTRPQLLFAVKKQDKILFFSSPQPQNPDANLSHVVCANELFSYPYDAEFCYISGRVNGLICLTHRRVSEKMKEIEPMICNPSTGQCLTLPKLKLGRATVKCFFGYDPIEKLFKVLAMCSTMDFDYRRIGAFDEYQILTVGGSGENLLWRIIKSCVPPHCSFDKGLFINGVLYYQAAKDCFSKTSMIVCFDFRSEKFSLVTITKDSIRVVSKGYLINYNGKLGSIVCDRFCGHVDLSNNISGSIELWVLEDDEKQEWSKRAYVLPAMSQHILGTGFLGVVGMSRRNEIVLSPLDDTPFCIFYYNIERNTITKVSIQGMEAVNGVGRAFVFKFLDHVEDVNLMQMF